MRCEKHKLVSEPDIKRPQKASKSFIVRLENFFEQIQKGEGWVLFMVDVKVPIGDGRFRYGDEGAIAYPSTLLRTGPSTCSGQALRPVQDKPFDTAQDRPWRGHARQNAP